MPPQGARPGGGFATTTSGGFGGSFRWDASGLNRKEIMKLDQPTINHCKARLSSLCERMVQYMKEHAEWTDHPDRHPSPHWPHSLTAREGLRGRIRGKYIIRIELSHSPRTIWRGTTSNKRYNYGYALEAGDNAIILPTLAHFSGQYIQALRQTLTKDYPDVPDRSFGSGASTPDYPG